MSITIDGTSGITQLKGAGTTTNDNAAAGQVGEYILGTRPRASALALTSEVAANISSILLTSGDWDIHGSVGYFPAASTTQSHLVAGISIVSATLGGEETYAALAVNIAAGLNDNTLVTPIVRVSLATTTTIYLIGRSTFAVSTCAGWGNISARRVR
jgi:hypothetical protein